MKTLKLAFIMALILMGACKKIDPFQITDNIDAHDFLSADEYEKLVIEIVYVEGHEPTSQALANLTSTLSERLNKPKGISVTTTQIESPGHSSYSIEDIKEIEKDHRELFPKKDVITAFVFVADAGYSGDSGSSKSIGFAYDPTSMVIFEKTIRDYSGGIGQPSLVTMESIALLHEFGHLLGLVNSGTLMTEHHQDVSNGHHCTDQDCIMYYAAETTDITGFLLGGNIPGFDAKCIADLRANGGK